MTKTYLAIDYGRTRVGIARSYGTLAEPLLILQHNQQLTATIEELVKKNSINELVIGVSEGEMAQESRRFGEQLAAELKLPVHFVDETLSSVSAKAKLRSSRKGKRQHTGHLDQFAATEFLQEWLDEGVEE